MCLRTHSPMKSSKASTQLSAWGSGFEDLKFLVMDRLIGKAAELDQEVRLVRSSKEAKLASMKDVKGKRGETKWKDPW